MSISSVRVESMNASTLDAALDAFREAVGAEHVHTDAQALREAATATFFTENEVPAIVLPAGREEVQRCLEIANEYRVPLYPISTGRNWGYGSRVPTRSGSIILDLSRLDRIVDFSEELSYVTVQPGVTQQALFDFLRSKDSNLWMDVTGSSKSCSLIGNTLERGFGHTPYGDHFAHVCSLEVVLPTGEAVRTGFGRFPNAKADRVYRWGVGAYLDGLFTQSNFGVITEMTIWLMPKPDVFQPFYVKVKSDAALEQLIDELRPLRMDGTINSTMHIANDFKILSSIRLYPWEESQGATPLSREVVNSFAKAYDFGAWNASGATYGSRGHVASARRKISRAVRRVPGASVRYMNETLIRLGELAAKPYKMLTGVHVDQLLKVARPVFGMKQGQPTDAFLDSAYWRKRTPVPDEPHLDRDRCGLIWCAPIAPTRGVHAREMVDIIYETFEKYGFDPAISMTMITERCLDNVISILYDREQAGEDQRALECHDELLERMTAAGYYPYRLGVTGMKVLNDAQDEHHDLLARLKAAVDPNNILAPGRYERTDG